MSEFFKALEQAERDRQLAEKNRQGAALADEGEGREPVVEDDAPRPADPSAAPSPALASASAAPIAPPPVVPAPAPPPQPARPSESRSVFHRPAPPVQRPAGPAAAGPVTSAGETARGVAPQRVERPAADRVPSPALERPAPRGRAPAPDPAPSVEADPAPLRRVTARPKRGDTPVLIADLDPRSVAAEAYRTLRANLEFIPADQACRSIVVTSPSMGEGKSTTAANLAVVAAQAGSRVCLVDADMRRPSLHKVFHVQNHGGFTRALSQAMPLASVAVPTDVPNLSLVVAGSADGLRPAQLLNGPRIQKVLHDPTTPFDMIIFDTPPLISVADAMHLAAQCDGVVLVVRAGAVPPSVLRQAVRQVEQVKGKVLGILLNQVDLRGGDAEFYRYYRAYYSHAKKD